MFKAAVFPDGNTRFKILQYLVFSFDTHDAYAIRRLTTPWQRSLFAVVPKAHLELQRRKVRGAGFRRRRWFDDHWQLTTSNYLDYSR